MRRLQKKPFRLRRRSSGESRLISARSRIRSRRIVTLARYSPRCSRFSTGTSFRPTTTTTSSRSGPDRPIAPHIRLYVGIGRRDGLTRRGIAQFFRDLIGVPERLVDRIEVMDAFSLATLPADAANAALDLSKQRRNVPHMHVDINDAGGDFHSGPRPGFRSGFPRR